MFSQLVEEVVVHVIVSWYLANSSFPATVVVLGATVDVHVGISVSEEVLVAASDVFGATVVELDV